MVFTIECSNHSNIRNSYLGGYSSIGRATVCGTVCSLFDSGYPPLDIIFVYIYVILVYNFNVFIYIYVPYKPG